MPDYQRMYLHLFNAVTDALRNMENQSYLSARNILICAQQECEEIYLQDDQ